MLLKCPRCGADIVAGAIRCGNCLNILVHNKQDVKAMRLELGKIATSDKPLEPEEQRYLNSWMEIQKKQFEYQSSVADRAIDVVLNSFIGAMIIMVTIAVFLYFYVYAYPNESMVLAQKIGLIDKPVVVSDF